MRFFASREGWQTISLSTTPKFVVIDNDDFNQIVGALNWASLLLDQIENPTDLDGDSVPKAFISDKIKQGHDGLQRARWMQLVIS